MYLERFTSLQLQKMTPPPLTPQKKNSLTISINLFCPQKLKKHCLQHKSDLGKSEHAITKVFWKEK